jgi:serine protease Do
MTAARLALLVLALGGCSRPDRGPEHLSLATFGALQAKPRVPASVDQSRRTAIVTSAARVSPSVVSVGVKGRQRVQPSPFDMFFTPEGNEQQVQSFGTGFVVRGDGVIITNQHVVEGADQITVTLSDGTDVPASLVGEDATTDIAVLKVARTGLPVAPLGSSDDLMIGEWLVALGNPYRFLLSNVEPTVTAGVVSAVGRNILPTGDQPGLYLDMIQTDAAINPGNSGGPLANALGEVIGVNASIFSSSGGSIGLGFAIPIERAMRVTEEILRRGEMHRAWTGIEVAGARQMQLTRSAAGLRIEAVATGSPAAVAGLRTGDILVLANGQKMRTWLDWEAVKLDVTVGDTVLVEVKSGTGPTVRRRIKTGELPSVSAEKVPALQDIQLVTVTPAIRAERHIAAEQGALIFSISPEAARLTGLEGGDVILAINNARVEDATLVGTTIERLRAARGFRVFFERDRRIRFTDLSFSQ